MKKTISLSLCAITILLLVSSCSTKVKPLSAAEHLDLGEKYMLELNYEQAIPHFLEAIEVDPKNGQAYIPLAEAYTQTGSPEKGQAVLEMGYAMVKDDKQILESLLDTMVANDDAQAAGRLINDAQRTGGQNARDLENELQRLANMGYTEFIEKLIAALYERGDNPLLALCLELWLISNREYEIDSDRSETIIDLLFERGKTNPQLTAGEEYYFGGYDDVGDRYGFGICYYGIGANAGGVVYIGYWDSGLRSGEGAAYYGVYYYIKGSWAEDLPNGAMTIGYKGDMASFAIMFEASYRGGVLQIETVHYYDDGRMPGHGIWDEGVSYIKW